MAKLKSGSHVFAAEHGEELMKFFAKAQIAYASGVAKPIISEDGTSMILYREGMWNYLDTWSGGEPYGGMTTIFYEDVVCFSMVYFGRVMPYAETDEVMACLMAALQHPVPCHPWRGPREFIAENGLHYTNILNDCSVRRFSGTERIMSADGKETLYEASYMGGIVNKD